MGGVGEGIFARGGRGVGEKVVGATRFELVTFCTPSKRATSLRYAPTKGVYSAWDVPCRGMGVNGAFAARRRGVV